MFYLLKVKLGQSMEIESLASYNYTDDEIILPIFLFVCIVINNYTNLFKKCQICFNCFVFACRLFAYEVGR